MAALAVRRQEARREEQSAEAWPEGRPVVAPTLAEARLEATRVEWRVARQEEQQADLRVAAGAVLIWRVDFIALVWVV